MASLDALPTDIHFMIFNYLICPLICYEFPRTPQIQQELLATEVVNRLKWTDKPLRNHPYFNLAAQSRTLRASIEAYCHHLLAKRLKNCKINVTDPDPKIAALGWSQALAEIARKKLRRPKPTCYRTQYVKWSFQHCLFCGKKSVRRACFNTHMWCCKTCDEREFGALISKSEAMKSYKINETNWMYAHFLYPEEIAEPVEFVCINLPIYHGAMVVRDADAQRVRDCKLKYDPKNTRVKALKPRLRQAEELRGLMRQSALDLSAITGLFTIMRDIAFPLDYPTFNRLQSHLATLRRTLNSSPFPVAARLANARDMQGYQRSITWLKYVMPDALQHNIKEKDPVPCQGLGTTGLKHCVQLPVRSIPHVPGQVTWRDVAFHYEQVGGVDKEKAAFEESERTRASGQHTGVIVLD